MPVVSQSYAESKTGNELLIWWYKLLIDVVVSLTDWVLGWEGEYYLRAPRSSGKRQVEYLQPPIRGIEPRATA